MLDTTVSSTNVSALDIRAVSLAYGDHKALDTVDLEILVGTLTAVIGPNGAGKSSLVKAICGRAPLKSGSILINGLDSGARAARRALGVAPQRMALYDQLTAFENLVCFACQAGLTRAEARERAETVLDLIDLNGARAKRICQMSGGMRQRINIGAAVAHQPRLVILDEPAASLDPAGVARINTVIERLKDEGYAILLITHDMAQAAQLADNVAILSAGQIIAHAPPQDLIETYCGDGFTLSALPEDTNTEAFSVHGFTKPANPGDPWTRTVATNSKVADIVNALAKDGADLSAFTVTAPDLCDAMTAAVAQTPS